MANYTNKQVLYALIKFKEELDRICFAYDHKVFEAEIKRLSQEVRQWQKIYVR